RAGTRIWAAAEALMKATDARSVELVVDRQDGDAVLFLGGTPGTELAVLTLPLELTRGPERMLAVVVEPTEEDAGAASAAEETGSLAERYDYDPSAYTLRVTSDGPIEGLVVVGI